MINNRFRWAPFAFAAALSLVLSASHVGAQEPDHVFDRGSLPIAPYQKPTKVAPILKDSVTPEWPRRVTPPKGAPNVVVVLTDDVGFGATTVFGGPVPATTYERLAQHGLRYNNFNTTALCSPSRAALITGRNHHQAATGIIM